MTTATTGRHRKPTTTDQAVTALFMVLFHVTAAVHNAVLQVARWFHLHSLLAARIFVGSTAGLVFVGAGIGWWFM